MKTSRSDGQRAYAAYCGASTPTDTPAMVLQQWEMLSDATSAAWEAVAAAVRALPAIQEPCIPRCRWCGQALDVHPQPGEPPWHCRLSDGPLLPT